MQRKRKLDVTDDGKTPKKKSNWDGRISISESEGMWIFTEEELENSPSRRDGISFEDENKYRRKIFNYVRKMGLKLKL